jgi:hypothetical protein
VRASYAGGQLTTPKSGKVRAVPMAPDVVGVLAQLGRREFWVCNDDLVFVEATAATSTRPRCAGATRKRSSSLAYARSDSTTSGTRSTRA